MVIWYNGIITKYQDQISCSVFLCVVCVVCVCVVVCVHMCACMYVYLSYCLPSGEVRDNMCIHLILFTDPDHKSYFALILTR